MPPPPADARRALKICAPAGAERKAEGLALPKHASFAVRDGDRLGQGRENIAIIPLFAAFRPAEMQLPRGEKHAAGSAGPGEQRERDRALPLKRERR